MKTNRTFIVITSLIGLMLLSHCSLVSAESNFQWGISKGDRFDYHIEIFSEMYSPDQYTRYETEYDAYIILHEIPTIPEEVLHYLSVTISEGGLWFDRMFFANGSQGAMFQFQAVAIGNWSELTGLYNASFQETLASFMNSSFIDTPSTWGYILHQDFIPGETYTHYEVVFSKSDGVLEYYLEDFVMPFGTIHNHSKEYTRLHPIPLIVIGIGVTLTIVIVGVVVIFASKRKTP